MKVLLLFILFTGFSQTVFSQFDPVGCFSRRDGIFYIKADSTFIYVHRADTYRGWSHGTWKVKRNKILFSIKAVYDTLLVKRDSVTYDSLVLSRDLITERITETETERVSVFNYEQNHDLCPLKLVYKKGRLYRIVKGKLQKKMVTGTWYKPFLPFYIKVKCEE